MPYAIPHVVAWWSVYYARARSPQHIRIGVWDTGPGIAEEQRIKLFQEFERCGHTSPWGEQGLRS